MARSCARFRLTVFPPLSLPRSGELHSDVAGLMARVKGDLIGIQQSKSFKMRGQMHRPKAALTLADCGGLGRQEFWRLPGRLSGTRWRGPCLRSSGNPGVLCRGAPTAGGCCYLEHCRGNWRNFLCDNRLTAWRGAGRSPFLSVRLGKVSLSRVCHPQPCRCRRSSTPASFLELG